MAFISSISIGLQLMVIVVRSIVARKGTKLTIVWLDAIMVLTTRTPWVVTNQKPDLHGGAHTRKHGSAMTT